MVLRHSERAKRNTRDQLDLQIATIEENIETIKKEIKLYEKYASKGLKFAERVLPSLHKKLNIRESQLLHYLEKKTEYEIKGLI